MTRVPIILPSFEAPSAWLSRSGFTLLRRNGDRCVRGEPLAHCYLRVSFDRTMRGELRLPYEEVCDLSAVVLAPHSGTVHWAEHASPGGWVNNLPMPYLEWRDSFSIGTLSDIHGSEAGLAPAECMLITTGRRLAPWADSRGDLIGGWYDFTRTWRFGGTLNHLIVATACPYRTAICGEHRIPDQFFLAAPVPLHLTYLAEGMLIPTAQSLIDELRRTPAEKAALLTELHGWLRSLHHGDSGMSAAYISALISRIQLPSPLITPPLVLQQHQVSFLESSPTVLVSVESEEARIFRHRDLPLRLALPVYLYQSLGTDLREILKSRFVPEQPRPEEFVESYRVLAGIIRERGGRLIVGNSRLSQRGTPVLRPADLADFSKDHSLEVRQTNRLLRNLELRGEITVLDVDRLFATLGSRHQPDGTHGDSLFDAALRDQIALLLSSAT